MAQRCCAVPLGTASVSDAFQFCDEVCGCTEGGCRLLVRSSTPPPFPNVLNCSTPHDNYDRLRCDCHRMAIPSMPQACVEHCMRQCQVAPWEAEIPPVVAWNSSRQPYNPAQLQPAYIPSAKCPLWTSPRVTLQRLSWVGVSGWLLANTDITEHNCTICWHHTPTPSVR